MKAIGITCGIGSMLIGAKQAGFEVVGNIGWLRVGALFQFIEGKTASMEN